MFDKQLANETPPTHNNRSRISWLLGCDWQNVSQRAAVALAALVLALLSSPYEVQGQTDRPNVLILFAADLGHGDVSYNGGDIPTPNIDALVADGVRFASGYMTAPLCNPSRAGLITGRYQQRWGQELNALFFLANCMSKLCAYPLF